MRRLVTGIAFLTSLLAFLVTAGTGLFLAGIEQSGERAAGVLMCVTAIVAFGAALLLVFRRPQSRALAALAALLALVPVAGLTVAALVFSGLPVGSAIPRLDWSVFAVGIVFALGAVSIAALGFLGTPPRAAPEAEPPEASLYEPLLAETARRAVEIDRNSVEIDENVRVRRV